MCQTGLTVEAQWGCWHGTEMGETEQDIWAAAGANFATSMQRSPESSGKRGPGKISYSLGWPRKEMQHSDLDRSSASRCCAKSANAPQTEHGCSARCQAALALSLEEGRMKKHF